MKQRYVRPGERVTIEMPWSEVCMHMRIAGRVMQAEVLPGGWSAQIYDMKGQPFSAPVTTGEAGFHHDSEGIYCYEKEAQS